MDPANPVIGSAMDVFTLSFLKRIHNHPLPTPIITRHPTEIQTAFIAPASPVVLIKGEKAKDKPTGRTDKLFGYVEISNNGVRCVRLMEDDRLRNIAKEFGISKKMLLYFNDMYKDEPLHSGDYVYLWFKKGRADKQFDYHEVKAGESMHSIAQQYGVKMKRLYKMNGMEYGTPVKIGMILKLR